MITPLQGAWLVALLALGAAWLGRRRLAVGVPEALFVSALSGALATSYLADATTTDQGVRLAAVLTALAVLWYSAARWVERTQIGVPPSPAENARHRVGMQAVIVSGLLAAGVTLAAAPASATRSRLSLTLCLTILLAVALRRARARGVPLARYAVLALLAGVGRVWTPVELLRPHLPSLALGLFVLAVIAVAAALLPVWHQWRRRRLVWRVAPERLLEPAPTRPPAHQVAAVLSTLVGLGALLANESILTPIAVALAAIAALTAAHRRPTGALADLGLALAGEAVALIAIAWLPDFGLNGLLGCALASIYLLWLARFWHQQLDDDRPWTTAGRLIPVARRLAHAAALGCGGAAAHAAAASNAPVSSAIWLGVLTAVALALLGFLLVLDGRRHPNGSAALAAVIATIAIAVPVQHVLLACAQPLRWPALIAGPVLLLALGVRAMRVDEPGRVTYNAAIGGMAPILLSYDVFVFASPGHYRSAVAAGVLVALALAVHGLPRRPRAHKTRPINREPPAR